jgi:polyisoprenoid-binding protein YceI
MRTLFARCAVMALVMSSGAAISSLAVDAVRAPAAIQGGKVALSPENTKIQFVCAHVGPKPDPRTGHFAKFSGTAEVEAAANALRSVSVEIDTNSITTEFDKLTAHLKSPDFFEVRQYPTAKFESTKITPGPGQVQITGKLTLHGKTNEISFPATVAVTPSGFSLKSEFNINRSQFGMTFGPDKVENKVAMTIVVGDSK